MSDKGERMNRTLHWVLVSGMALSFFFLVIGLIMYAISPTEGGDLPIDRMAEGILRGDPIAVIDLGIVLLIATPLVRVIAAGAMFAVERDYRFVAIATFVFAMIVLAVFLRL